MIWIRNALIAWSYFKIRKKQNKFWCYRAPIFTIEIALLIGFSKRTQQLKELIPLLEKSPYKRILCSDLNDTPVSYAYNQLSNQFIDSFTKSGFGIGGTYIGKIPFLRIDYIWHDKSLDSYNFQTHQIQLSDHKAISVDILLK